MVQAEDGILGCICPECFNRCTDCLGTNSVLSKEDIEAIKKDELTAKLYMQNRSDD